MKNNAVSNVTSRSLSNYAPRPQPGLSIGGSVQAPQVSRSSSVASHRGMEQVKKSTSSGTRGLIRPPAGKDFSKPLFVDCSIEYELPNAPKIPKNSLPILMIHPGYKQKMSMIQQKSKPEPQCSTPNCQCKLRKIQPQQPQALQPQVKKDIKAGMKRSYNTMTSSSAVAQSTDFYMKHLQPQNHPGEYFYTLAKLLKVDCVDSTYRKDSALNRSSFMAETPLLLPKGKIIKTSLKTPSFHNARAFSDADIVKF